MLSSTTRSGPDRRLSRTATGVLATIAVLTTLPMPAFAQDIDLTGVGHDRGQPDSPVRVVEFGDFGCHACALFAHETLPVVQEEFIATGKVFWKYVPVMLGIFPNDEEAARAAECAAEQDAFWEMHDHLFAEQESWTSERDADELFAAYAAELELDGPAFQRCYDENQVAERIERANDVAGQLGVRATPTFVINGERIQGALPPADFREILEKAASGS